MKIGIDARLMGKDVRGIGRYVEELLKELANKSQNIEYTVFTREESASLVPSGMKTVLTDIRWYTLREQLELGKIFDAEKLDFIHVPHWNAPLTMKTPLLVTIHDMILWEHPTLATSTLPAWKYWLKYWAYRFVLATNAKRASKIFTVSQSAKNAILRHLPISPEKISVTPLGVNPFPPAPAAGKASPYVLSVGSGYPHKNVKTFFLAFKELVASDRELRAKIVGTDPAFRARLAKQAEEILGLDFSRVDFAGLVSDSELGALYKNAQALIFTSQAEGFGLPLLEAALADIPIVASAIDTSREMMGNAIPFVAPLDAKGFAQKFQQIQANLEYKNAIIASAHSRIQAFNWERTAELTLDAYRQAFSTISR